MARTAQRRVRKGRKTFRVPGNKFGFRINRLNRLNALNVLNNSDSLLVAS